MALLYDENLYGPPPSEKCYDTFKSYLSTLGFTIYPIEFECVSSKHPFVDIAAKMGPYYWAFEYKSEHDSITRGVEQLRCYSEWFDYVLLVSERTVNHQISENYWLLKNFGAGIWLFDPLQNKCVPFSQPQILSPEAGKRSFISRRFASFSRMRQRFAKSKEGQDLRLDSWVSES